MPIVARTTLAAAKELEAHLTNLLANTITKTPLIAFTVGGDRSTLVDVGFRQHGKPQRAPLATKFGNLELLLRQHCEGVRVKRNKYQLQTIRYNYDLQMPGEAEPLLRWEYVRKPKDDEKWCRHHIHIHGTLPLFQSHGVPLKAVHVPTRYTLIEDIIRFCISDLEVVPLNDDWSERLEESVRKFKEEFVLPTD